MSKVTDDVLGAKSTAHEDEGNLSIEVKTPTTAVKPIQYYYDYPNYHRWLLVIVATILAFFLGAPFMNWPPIEYMFDESGAYNYMCTPTSEGYREGLNGVVFCKDKQVEISKIAGFSQGMMFVFSCVAGILLDSFGSKICSLFGATSIFLGWLIISFSGINFNGFKAGTFFLAAGSDPCLFGFLSIGNLFPKYVSTVIGVLGAARSVTYAISLLMQSAFAAGYPLRTIGLVFCAILLVCMITILVLIPMQSFPRLPHGRQLDREPGEGKISVRQHVKRRQKVSLRALATETIVQVKGWFKEARNIGYFVFFIGAILTLLRNGYYMASHNEHLHYLRSFYEDVSPTSFIPCPFLGWFADRFSAALCMTILATAGALSMFLVIFDVAALQGISIMCNWLFISFVSSQFYCYGGAVFPQKNMGKLVGVVMAVGGLMSLLSQNMYEFASASSARLLTMDILVVAFEVVSIILTIGLYLFVERPIRRAAVAKIKAQNDAEEVEEQKEYTVEC